MSEKTRLLAYISQDFIDFMKDPDALSQEILVHKYGGTTWSNKGKRKALPMVVTLEGLDE